MTYLSSMKIVVFGDSFQQNKEGLVDPSSYEGMLTHHYDCQVEFLGDAGSGPWHAFFKCKKYLDDSKDNLPDVIIFGWSEACRNLYHPNYSALNGAQCRMNYKSTSINPEEREVYKAGLDYYRFLSSNKKENYELKSLMMYFDNFTLNYPDIKFINLHNFSWLERLKWWDMYDKLGPRQLTYHHTFKNSAEIRPALIWLSRRDGWPLNDRMENENRNCHLTPAMHRLLADVIISAIDYYSPGKIFEIEPRLMDKQNLQKMVIK